MKGLCVAAALASFVLVLFFPAATRAGTTGTLSVTVVDSNGVPVSGARVSAASPSQTAMGTTNAHGFLSLIDLSPDTYVVSVTKDGFIPIASPGLTVIADQTVAIDVTLRASPKVLGPPIRVSAQIATVNGSVTSDVYSVNANAASQYSGSMGGSETLNSQYGVLSSLPGVIRTVGTGSGYYGNNMISVRGGTPDQIGFELEGVPLNRSFDKYNGGSFAMNGIASIELYTGGENADSGHSMSGYVNGTIQRGSYPGGADLSAFVGGPAYSHSLQADVKGGTANGKFTYFVSTLAMNSSVRYSNASNLDNTSISVPANDPGCPLVNFINGSSLNCAQPNVINLPISQAPLEVLGTLQVSERNSVANFHYSISHDGLADDLQALYMVDYTGSPFPYSGGTIDPNIANATNAQNQIVWPSGELYQGAVGQPFNPANFLLLTWPSSNGSTGPIPSWYYDGQSTQQSVEKLGYTHLFSQSALLRVYTY
jgi:Carboxypeptidase regulatory-like domain/TonB-dependent Receptor Plug Domain